MPYSIFSMAEMTDKDLPHIDPHQAGQLYALMIEVDKALKENNIPYWGAFGTLLGAIRHKGLIPWDDDIDVCIFEQSIEALEGLAPVLEREGLILLGIEKEGTIDYYKIFPANGKTYEKYTWRYPFVDVFPMKIFGDKAQYASKRLREAEKFKNNYFLFEEELSADPFEETQFGPMELPIPNNPTNVLARFYGDDWNEIAYAEYDHREEQKLDKVIVSLEERAQVAYILPE